MARQTPTPLADALAAWLDRMGVTPAHVARYGGLQPTTVFYIARGTTTRPHEETLAGLARGIATSRPPRLERDDQIERSCLDDLRLAAGYLPVDLARHGTLVEIGLWVMFRSERRTLAWMDTIARLAALSDEQVRALGRE